MMNARTFAVAVITACAITLMAGCSQQAVSSGAASSVGGASAESTSSSAGSVGGASAESTSSSAGNSGGEHPSESSESDVTYVLDGDIMAEIHLDYSAGTGFEWQCEVEPEGVIGIVSQETRSLDDDELLAGGPLRDVVVIASKAPGQATVTCSLVRPWETDSEPAEVQTFVYEVDEATQLHFKADESSFTNAPEMIALS